MMLWRNPHRRLQERLSAYLDGELSPEHVRALELHLRSCDSCMTELAGLQLASTALAEWPDVEVPRSFALTPELIGKPAPAAGVERSLNAGLRLAGGALAAALAVVLVLDAGGIVGNGGENASSGGGSRQDAYDKAATSAPPASDEDAKERLSPGGVAVVTPAPGNGIAQPEPTGGAGTEASRAAPTPAPTAFAGDVFQQMEPNSSPVQDSGTLTGGLSNEDSDDGLSALTVTEIVLAALLGVSIVGIVAATYAGRRRG